MKKIVSFVLALSLLLCMAPAVFAADDEATQAAQTLYELGLFKGTGTNEDGTPIFDLDKTPTRNQAIIMLVRLLGKEDEALAGTWNIPFTDVSDSMKPYIGYAYTNGLTNGTSATTYSGTNTIRANQYIAFVLRALGYESGKDFEVSTSWELADELGVTDGSYNASTTTFTRGDVAKISLAAHEIQETVATAPYWGLSADIKWIAEPTTTEDFTNNVLYSFLMGNYSLNFTNYPIDNSDPETFVKTVRRQVKALCSKYTALMGVYYNATIGSGVDGDLLFIDFPNASLDAETIYQQQQTALKTAQQIKADLRQQGKITDSMSQLEIAQAYYDYLVSLNVQPGGGSAEAEQGKSVEYDSAYACLVNKKADCVGQVAAFNLLMHLEGISAMGVSGTYKASNSSILVSMVTLDGKTYYCDWSDRQPLTQDVSSWLTIH